MFEKSLFDLIKGLRNHKGSEEDYVQDSLRECKAEIKSQDMDKKATALLKLIYLEMFGYDMSWASFHVLEVMSCTKYLQKRAGYLAAVQSFRPDTEVLMLATNLLKKDLISSNISNMALPLITLPNIITPSLAISLLPEVLSRLSHSYAVVRKKAVVCLYRLALVYPEALKLAWPKIKDRLMDDEEDSSVTTAVINVVCELGWRRPHDFLPLAPRLFDLLVDGGNNWMAIKIIKLFATLTPLEPRLIRKLLRPLMNIIETTTAMSLLYECINGIIQGGILNGNEGLDENEEIVSLCVGKLRGMIVTDSDPNLKYVALLSYNRIVTSYPTLVSTHQDVIMSCLEDPDISIRLQALELAARMISSDTLQQMVNRLTGQLIDARQIKGGHTDVRKSMHSGWEDTGLQEQESHSVSFALPADYIVEVLHRILDMCSHNNYSDLPDFVWYVEILGQLVTLIPPASEGPFSEFMTHQDVTSVTRKNIALRIGSEIRNVAVRVMDVRREATIAAESLLLTDKRQSLFFVLSDAVDGILGPLAWVVGEYATHLSSPIQTLQSLVDMSSISLPARTLSLYIQAIPKVIVSLIQNDSETWHAKRLYETSLLLAQVQVFLETLSTHPDLDVQERAIEFLEVVRLATDAIQPGNCELGDEPFLLSSIIPSLFRGLELNPVATNAQRKVPLPDRLLLNQTFNNNLYGLFRNRPEECFRLGTQLPTQDFYYINSPSVLSRPFDRFTSSDTTFDSYQDSFASLVDEGTDVIKRNVERRERNQDDPFYIGADDRSPSTPNHFYQPFNRSHGDELDIDSIPIIDLKLDDGRIHHTGSISRDHRRPLGSHPKKHHIASDETIGRDDLSDAGSFDELNMVKRSPLQVDSSGLKHLSLEGEGVYPSNRKTPGLPGHDAEMAVAMQKVERLRLEMQRASERVRAHEHPAEGTLVKKKRKVKKSRVSGLHRGVDPLYREDIVEGDCANQKAPAAMTKKKRLRKRSTSVQPER